MLTPRGLRAARIAKKHGMLNPFVAANEAHRAKLPYYIGYALMEQESGDGANIFGHDPTIYAGAGQVTKDKYLAYKRQRGHSRMQGVGPVQLTWWATQDAADRLGGCWRPKYSIRVGFQTLAALIRANGRHEGFRRYNGSGPAAEAYAKSLEAKAAKWKSRLN
jgi:hypothetical protein